MIDTNDLKDSVKTTSRDIAVVEKLEAVLVASRTYNRKRLYDAVKQAKIDVSAMTVLEILAKDYKAIRRAPDAAGSTRTASIGMSTVPLSFEVREFERFVLLAKTASSVLLLGVGLSSSEWSRAFHFT